MRTFAASITITLFSCLSLDRAIATDEIYLTLDGESCYEDFIEPIKYNQLDGVKHSVEKGSNPNCQDTYVSDGATPLELAIEKAYENKDLSIVKYLLDHGANPNYLGLARMYQGGGRAYGSFAIILGLNYTAISEEIIDLLITHGGNPSLGSLWDRSPFLHLVSNSSRWEDSGAIFRVMWKLYNTKKIDVNRVELIEPNTFLNSPVILETPLIAASFFRHSEDKTTLIILKALLSMGAKVNFVIDPKKYVDINAYKFMFNIINLSPLAAATLGTYGGINYSALELLLQSGANPNYVLNTYIEPGWKYEGIQPSEVALSLVLQQLLNAWSYWNTYCVLNKNSKPFIDSIRLLIKFGADKSFVNWTQEDIILNNRLVKNCPLVKEALGL